MTVHILNSFPKLSSVDLTVTSPKTPSHNCIAYAAGDTQRWWWPDAVGVCYWPPDVPRISKIVAFQKAFESLGYSLAADDRLEYSVEKIAVFAKYDKPTHAARQLESGFWSSKLGSWEDVSHPLRDLEGDLYGWVAFVMGRPR